MDWNNIVRRSSILLKCTSALSSREFPPYWVDFQQISYLFHYSNSCSCVQFSDSFIYNVHSSLNLFLPFFKSMLLLIILQFINKTTLLSIFLSSVNSWHISFLYTEPEGMADSTAILLKKVLWFMPTWPKPSIWHSQ